MGPGGASVEWHPGMACLPGGGARSAAATQVCTRPRANAALLARAVAAARAAAQVVVVLNLQSVRPCDAEGPVDGEFNPCGYEAEQHDRYRTDLPRVQPVDILPQKTLFYRSNAGLQCAQLRPGSSCLLSAPAIIHGRERLALAVLAATRAAGVPTAVVLVHGGALSIERVKAGADAILDAHYPGMATGATAVAETLWGAHNPSGKLTYSVFPSQFTNLSDFTSMDMVKPPGRTYKYYPTAGPPAIPPVLWPFGWGLSYTQFALTCALLPAAAAGRGAGGAAGAAGAATVSCRVANVGKVAGAEVLFVYYVPAAGSAAATGAPAPHKVLVDFRRVGPVAAGGAARADFTVTGAQLELPTASGGRVLVGRSHVLEISRGHGETAQVVVNF